MRAPSEPCNRCGGPNFIWSAPSPLWNAVMRDNDINGPSQFGDLVCVQCFMDLATERGVVGNWRLTIDPLPDNLVMSTPSGRWWDWSRWLWRDA